MAIFSKFNFGANSMIVGVREGNSKKWLVAGNKHPRCTFSSNMRTFGPSVWSARGGAGAQVAYFSVLLQICVFTCNWVALSNGWFNEWLFVNSYC